MSRGAARQDWIALLGAAGWTAATALGRHLGFWLFVGGTAVVLGALVFGLEHEALRPRLELRPGTVLLGALAGAGMIACTYLFYPLAARAPWVGRDLTALYAAVRTVSPRSAAWLLLPVVFGEELVWRGAVQGALERHLGRPCAGLLAAGAYALAHAPTGSPLLVATAFACGLVWGGLRAATGNLWPALLAHLAWDAVVLIAYPLARSS